MGDAPSWLPEKYHNEWRSPQRVAPAGIKDRGFRKVLRAHGYASPNFRLSEFASKADGCGCSPAQPPRPKRIQRLCFKLERVRHHLGDHAIGVLSGYRSPCHNSCVGGASASEHMDCQAIDPIKPDAVSWDEFNAAMRREFENGGIGSGCVSGHVMHVDTGAARRWCYPGS